MQGEWRRKGQELLIQSVLNFLFENITIFMAQNFLLLKQACFAAQPLPLESFFYITTWISYTQPQHFQKNLYIPTTKLFLLQDIHSILYKNYIESRHNNSITRIFYQKKRLKKHSTSHYLLKQISSFFLLLFLSWLQHFRSLIYHI